MQQSLTELDFIPGMPGAILKSPVTGKGAHIIHIKKPFKFQQFEGLRF